MKKTYRRVKAGELGLADILSGDTIRVIGLGKYYTDTEFDTDHYGRPFERGKTLRATAINSIIDYFNLKDLKTTQFILTVKRKPVDELFTELMSLDGIGQESAILACIALLDKLPDLKYIYSTAIHKSLFVSYGDNGINQTIISNNRENMLDTILFEENARKTATAIATSMLASSKLKDKPQVDDVVELALDINMMRNGPAMIDKNIHWAETGLRGLINTTLPVPNHNANTDKYTESALTPGFSTDQLEAFNGILGCDRGVMLLQGMPGSGKSTVITAIVREYAKQGSVPLVTSFMNKACLNLTERMPDYCFKDLYKKPGVPTLHSVYGKLVNSRENKTYRWPLIIVDESSVLSSELLYMLMKIHSYSPDTRILLVGDRNQLPPVCAYGTPFHNLMKRGDIVKFELSEFHRSNGAGIYSLLCKLMGSAPNEKVFIDRSDDVHLFKAKDSLGAMSIAMHIVEEHRDNMRDFVAVAETNRLRRLLNLYMASAHLGMSVHDIPTRKEGNEPAASPIIPGMRIVSKENCRENRHVSGDIVKNEFGTLVELDDKHAIVCLDIMGRRVTIDDPKMYMSMFDCGYASTVHKFQGSEAKEVLYCLEDYRNLSGGVFFKQKELKYVGMSRAVERLNIVAIDELSPTPACREVSQLHIQVEPVDRSFMCI
jgi:hypothetical protein